MWQKLLHAPQGHSLVEHQAFFLSHERTLASEWRETLKALAANPQSSGFVSQSVACAFVARRKFFTELGLIKEQDYECPDYQGWRAGLNPKGVALVFSSSYPNNPASHFGHTFLRIKKERAGNDLLDYAISYSAIVDPQDPGVLYAMKGIFGGYQGRFDFSPYYTMVGIYNNNESRDLLEYEIELAPAEIERMIDHVWELYSTATFPYYFFDENCSSVLARLLEVARPSWDLSAGKIWYYLPSDLVRNLVRESQRENVTLKRKARPSLKEVARLREEMLTSSERETLNNIKSDNLAEAPTPVLDAYLARQQFAKFKTKNQMDAQEKANFAAALRLRAARPHTPPPLNFRPSYPESGHEARAVGVALQSVRGSEELVLQLKQGYHDLYNHDAGQVAYSQFDFLEARALYQIETQKLRLDQLKLIDIYSAHPMSRLDPQVSWLVRVGRERAFEKRDSLHYRHQLAAAMGVSAQPWGHLFSLMLGAQANESRASFKRGGLGPLARAVVIFNYRSFIKLGAEAEYSAELTSSLKESARLALIGTLALNLQQNFDLRFISRYDKARLWQGNTSYAVEAMFRF